MRKFLLFLMPAALFLLFSGLAAGPFAAPASAQHEGFQDGSRENAPGPQGGFSGPGIGVSTAAQALKMRDDTFVLLQGNITRSIGKERYIFRDDTGEITVDIDSDIWQGRTVTPEMKVELYGEIDKEYFDDIEVDVSRLAVLN